MDIIYHIDRCDASMITGWAVHDSGIQEIRMHAEGTDLGCATLGYERRDVHDVFPHFTESGRSGFHFPFECFRPRGLFTDVTFQITSRSGSVARETRKILSLREGVSENVFRPGVDHPFRSGLPFEVTKLLHKYAPRTYHLDGVWTEELMGQATRDLKEIWIRGCRVPSLNRYVLFLRGMLHRFQGIRQQFPKFNNNSHQGAKDEGCVATAPEEMLCIANQLYVLRSNGLNGHFLEFGCFKGHSSSCLSHACHELGLPMEIFDSFAGLPPSDSTYYAAGEFCGSFEEVSDHIAEFGKPQVVNYHKGYFADTVPHFKKGPILCIWMDVDLYSSAQDVAHLLDRLPRASALFTHEFPPDGVQASRVVPTRSEVFPPIIDRLESLGWDPTGRHLFSCTGAIWDAKEGIPVLPYDCILTLARLGLEQEV